MTYVAFKKPRRAPTVGKFSTRMRFIIKQDDGQAVDVKDEYKLDNFEVVTADYMLDEGVSSCRISWASMNKRTERVSEHRLGERENLIEDVMRAVTSFMGMKPCEGTEVARNSTSHTCFLSGVYIGNVKVLVRLFFRIADLKGVPVKPTVELAVRSENEDISDAINEMITRKIITFLQG